MRFLCICHDYGMIVTIPTETPLGNEGYVILEALNKLLEQEFRNGFLNNLSYHSRDGQSVLMRVYRLNDANVTRDEFNFVFERTVKQ